MLQNFDRSAHFPSFFYAVTSAHPTTNHQNTLKTINPLIFWHSHIFWINRQVWKSAIICSKWHSRHRYGLTDLPPWNKYYKFIDHKEIWWNNLGNFTRLTPPLLCFADSSLISRKNYHEKSQKVTQNRVLFTCRYFLFCCEESKHSGCSRLNVSIMAAQEDPENKVDLNDISFGFRAWVWCFARVTVTDGPIYCAAIYR